MVRERSIRAINYSSAKCFPARNHGRETARQLGMDLRLQVMISTCPDSRFEPASSCMISPVQFAPINGGVFWGCVAKR